MVHRLSKRAATGRPYGGSRWFCGGGYQPPLRRVLAAFFGANALLLRHKSCAHGLALGDVVQHLRVLAVGDDHVAALGGGHLGGPQLRCHASGGQVAALLPGQGQDLRRDLLHHGDEPGTGVPAGVGGIQPLNVAEQHQQVGLGRAGHNGPQGVVVAHLDLLGGDGVVLIDDGQGTQLQQAGHGIFKVPPPVGVVHVLPGEQDLGHRVVILGEQLVIGIHQLALAHGGGRLFGGHVAGAAWQIQLAHPHADGTGGHQDHLVSRVFQVGQHLYQLLHMADVQPPGGVCQGRGAHFYHDAHVAPPLSLAQGLGFLKGGDHRVDGGGPEAVGLQHPHALDGAAPGGAHRVLHRAGVRSGLAHELGCALHGLGGIAPGLVPGQAAGHRAVGQGFGQQGTEGRTAAGQGAGRVDEPLVHLVHQAGGGQQGLEVLQLAGLHVHAAELDDPRAHLGRGVGHEADDGIVRPRQLLNAPGGEARRHRGQHEPVLPPRQDGGDGLQQPLHHLGLYPQEDQLALGGHCLVVRGLAAQLVGM